MSGNHNHDLDGPTPPGWRNVLWIALALNFGMFIAEIVAGLHSGSSALQADALDFLGDSANYAISLLVAGMALHWRTRAALLKGASMGLFGVWVIGVTFWHMMNGVVPDAPTMGLIGVLAMLVNVGVAVMLYRYRTGDANMRSVWICSRNDAIGNIAVMVAALGVFGTGTAWPDTIVALIMAGLGLWGAWQVITHAWRELRRT
ncbi:MAG TPA: cation transporter [Alphaproteobacteria bacterium]|nr:cation transporter [Alphaproteobacteria bacterium]